MATSSSAADKAPARKKASTPKPVVGRAAKAGVPPVAKKSEPPTAQARVARGGEATRPREARPDGRGQRTQRPGGPRQREHPGADPAHRAAGQRFRGGSAIAAQADGSVSGRHDRLAGQVREVPGPDRAGQLRNRSRPQGPTLRGPGLAGQLRLQAPDAELPARAARIQQPDRRLSAGRAREGAGAVPHCARDRRPGA